MVARRYPEIILLLCGFKIRSTVLDFLLIQISFPLMLLFSLCMHQLSFLYHTGVCLPLRTDVFSFDKLRQLNGPSIMCMVPNRRQQHTNSINYHVGLQQGEAGLSIAVLYLPKLYFYSQYS